MIDLQEIYETIDAIKRNGTTIGQAERLALLYIAADYMRREENEKESREQEHEYVQAAAPDRAGGYIDIDARSEFLNACNGSRTEDVLRIMDEHMDAIRILYPREFRKVLEMIENKKRE